MQYVWRKRIILTVCKLLLPRYFIINFLGPKYGHYVEDAVRRVLYLIMVIRTALLERTTVQEKVVQDRERYWKGEVSLSYYLAEDVIIWKVRFTIEEYSQNTSVAPGKQPNKNMPNNPRRPFIEESSKIVSELGLHKATVEMTRGRFLWPGPSSAVHWRGHAKKNDKGKYFAGS